MTTTPSEILKYLHVGKVRASAQIPSLLNQRIIHTSNRISAFDTVFPFEIPNKGKILQKIAAQQFKLSKVANHFLGELSENNMLVRNALVLPVEWVVRRTLSGSLWRLYSNHGANGVAKIYGISLPNNLKENSVFPEPILTPTSKENVGHDEPLHKEKLGGVILSFLESQQFFKNLSPSELTLQSQKILKCLEAKCFELFQEGESFAKQKKLILCDTKYEFGLSLDSNISNMSNSSNTSNAFEILAVDEIHTPDSSRFLLQDEKPLSKEIFRSLLLTEFPSLAHCPKPAEYLSQQEKIWSLSWQKSVQQRISEAYAELSSLFSHNEEFSAQTNIYAPWPTYFVSQQNWERIVKSATTPAHICLFGNGGRDYSLAQFFERFPECFSSTLVPGNRKWNLEKSNSEQLKNVSLENLASKFSVQNTLVVSGPELPLAQGLADICLKNSIAVLGTNIEGATLETSKIYCKNVALQAGVETPKSRVLRHSELISLLRNMQNAEIPFSAAVYKFEGLASGKGVAVVNKHQDIAQAIELFEANSNQWLQEATKLEGWSLSKQENTPCYLEEELLVGDEVSVVALCNGTHFRLCPIARDYKRRNDFQTGPNTGGMGSVCPVELPNNLIEQAQNTFSKLLNTLANDGKPYFGFLFAGFMIYDVGTEKICSLLELNCRMGDPEAQTILPGLGRDFVSECNQISLRQPTLFPNMSGKFFEHDGLKRTFVVGAAPEYPTSSVPMRSVEFSSFENFKRESLLNDKTILNFIPSGIEASGQSNAGRVCGVLATESVVGTKTFAELSKLCTAALAKCALSGVPLHFRNDIGLGL